MTTRASLHQTTSPRTVKLPQQAARNCRRPRVQAALGLESALMHMCDSENSWSIAQLETPGLQSNGSRHRPDVAVVLVQPQIPQNTGNIARSCAATNVALHLVGPLGFELDDRKLKRAGLDYWQHVCVKVHDSWEAFYEFFQGLPGQQRLIGYSVYGDTYYAGPEFSYQPGDWLLFGAETTGLPLQAHQDIINSGGCLVKIPIQDTYVRSLNQSVCVGVGLFEALRQLDVGSHAVQPRDDASSPAVRLPTPMQQQAGQAEHVHKLQGPAAVLQPAQPELQPSAKSSQAGVPRQLAQL